MSGEWGRQGVDRWTRNYGGGVTGEVYTVAAGLFTGGIRSLFGDDLTLGENFGWRAGHRAAQDAVDAMRLRHEDRLFKPTVYVGSVAMWLHGAEYPVLDQYVEGEHVFDHPDYVIEVGVGRALADLIWDDKGWRIIVYPRQGSGHDRELSVGLTDTVRTMPEQVLRLARPVLDEARRRYPAGDAS